MRPCRFTISRLGSTEYVQLESPEDRFATSPNRGKWQQVVEQCANRQQTQKSVLSKLDQFELKPVAGLLADLATKQRRRDRTAEAANVRKRFSSSKNARNEEFKPHQKGLMLLRDHINLINAAQSLTANTQKINQKPSDTVKLERLSHKFDRTQLLGRKTTAGHRRKRLSIDRGDGLPKATRNIRERRKQITKATLDSYFEVINERNIPHNVDKTIGLYQSLREIGYCEKKLTQFVERLCSDKAELRKTFLECGKRDPLTDIINYSVRTVPGLILNQIKEVGFQKSPKGFDQYLSEVLLYCKKVEQTVIDDQKRKVLFLQKSIKEFHNTCEISKLRELDLVDRKGRRIGVSEFKRLGNVLADIERRFGEMYFISDLSLKVYECLSKAEDRIQESTFKENGIVGN